MKKLNENIKSLFVNIEKFENRFIAIAGFVALFTVISICFAVYGLLKQDPSGLSSISSMGQWISGTSGVILTFITFIMILFTFFFQHREFKRLRYQTYQGNIFSIMQVYRDKMNYLYAHSKEDDGTLNFDSAFKVLCFALNDVITENDLQNKNHKDWLIGLIKSQLSDKEMEAFLVYCGNKDEEVILKKLTVK